MSMSILDMILYLKRFRFKIQSFIISLNEDRV